MTTVRFFFHSESFHKKSFSNAQERGQAHLPDPEIPGLLVSHHVESLSLLGYGSGLIISGSGRRVYPRS